MPKQTKHWKVKFARMVDDVTEDAFRRLMRDPAVPVYLYYRKSTDAEYGQLVVSNGEIPDGCERVNCQPLSPALAKGQLREKINHEAGWLPILPTALGGSVH